MIDHTLFDCTNYLQSDRSDQQVQSKQLYGLKSNLGTGEENVKLHTKVVKIVSSNDSNYLL